MGVQLSTRTKSSKSSPALAKKLASKASNGKAGTGSSRPVVAPKNSLKAKPTKVISKSAPVKAAAKSVTIKATKKATKVVAAKPKTKTVSKGSKAPVVALPKAKSPIKTVKVVTPAKKMQVKKVLPPPPPPKVKPVSKAAKAIPRQIITNQALSIFEKALKLFNSRDYSQAKEKFLDLHVRFHSEVEIIARSQTYIQICEIRLASQNTVPRNADEYYDRGIVALNVGDFLQARSLFEKALKLRPDDSHTLYSLAATLAQTDIEQSLTYLSKAVQKHPRLRQRALNDADFSTLKEDRRFLELLGASSPFDLLEARREHS
jgi:hypothetical protein